MKALITYKKSKLELLAEHDNKKEMAYLEKNPELFETYKRAHEANKKSFAKVKNTLDELNIEYVSKWRGGAQLEADANEADFVLAVGGDGTFIDTARYIRDDTPLIGVNSDESLSKGYFCSQTPNSLQNMLDAYVQGKLLPTKQIPRMSVYVNGELERVALNDIVISQGIASMQHNHVSLDDGEAELWKNTGLLISTGAGSTAYMSNAGGVKRPLNDTHIQYAELLMKNAKHGLTNNLEIASLNHDQKIYADGDYDIVDLEFGDVVRCVGNQYKLTLV